MLVSFESRNSFMEAGAWLQSAEHMVLEHWIPKVQNTYIGINVADDIIRFKHNYPGIKIVLYNLEHKYPQISPGILNNCSSEWLKYFQYLMTFIDEVWDFNIENYEYFRDIGYGDKFKFAPLRYTAAFERYIVNTTPKFDLEFEAVFDRQERFELINILTTKNKYGKFLEFKLANTGDFATKLREKQDARFGFDFPHYNGPETINAFRIFECLCINRQPIVYDKYHIGTRSYFGDLPIYLEQLNPDIIWDVTRQEPRIDVAEKFKAMTYTDEAYEQYRRNIVEDFRQRTGMEVPDSVLAKIC